MDAKLLLSTALRMGSVIDEGDRCLGEWYLVLYFCLTSCTLHVKFECVDKDPC